MQRTAPFSGKKPELCYFIILCDKKQELFGFFAYKMKKHKIQPFFTALYDKEPDLLSSETSSRGFTVSSAHAGRKPLLTAFRADLIFAHAQQ